MLQAACLTLCQAVRRFVSRTGQTSHWNSERIEAREREGRRTTKGSNSRLAQYSSTSLQLDRIEGRLRGIVLAQWAWVRGCLRFRHLRNSVGVRAFVTSGDFCLKLRGRTQPGFNLQFQVSSWVSESLHSPGSMRLPQRFWLVLSP